MIVRRIPSLALALVAVAACRDAPKADPGASSVHRTSPSSAPSSASVRAASTAPDAASSASAAPAKPSRSRHALTAKRFRDIVESLSEPDAEFFSDNFVSNETSYLQPAAALARYAPKGGAYVGVVPEQNFTYIALTQPARAFVVDIRRDNLVLHLLYKALFDLATSRAEFLALLTGRPHDDRPTLANDAAIERVVAHAERQTATRESFDEIHGQLRDRVESTYGISLSAKDRKSFESAHRAFFRDGLDIRFKLKEKSYRRYPPLRALLTARDPVVEQQLGFLASEHRFRFVQRMQREHRILPLTGNFGGDHALRKLGEHLRSEGLTVSAFYVSNVEQYLLRDGLWWTWIRNVDGLPTGDDSLFIRCYLDQGRAHPRQLAGHRTTTVLQRIADFSARNAERPYRSMYRLSVDEWRPAAVASTPTATAATASKNTP